MPGKIPEEPSQEEILDSSLVQLLKELAEDQKNLSKADTDRFIDYALIRYCTNLSIKSDRERGLSERLSPEEYGLIREAFKDDMGDEALALIIFQYHLAKIIGKALSGKMGIINAEQKSSVDDIVAKMFSSGAEIKPIDMESLDEMRKMEKNGLPEAGLAEVYTDEYMQSMIEKFIADTKARAEREYAEYKESASSDKKAALFESAQNNVTVYTTLEGWKNQFRVIPLWGRALKFLETIDFQNRMANGTIDERACEAVQIALELYGISGIDLKSIAEQFDSLKGSFYDDEIIRHENELRNLSPNSAKAQQLLKYLFSVDDHIAAYIVKDMFGADEERKKADEELDIAGEMKMAQVSADSYIKEKMLCLTRYWNRENDRLRIKGIKTIDDHVRRGVLSRIDSLRKLIRFAYIDSRYAAEEVPVIKFLAKTRYGVRDRANIGELFNDCRDLGILIISKDKKLKGIFETVLFKSPYKVYQSNDIGEAYDIFRNEKPCFIFVDSWYSNGGSAREVIELLLEDINSSTSVRKNIKGLYLLCHGLTNREEEKRIVSDLKIKSVLKFNIMDLQELLGEYARMYKKEERRR